MNQVEVVGLTKQFDEAVVVDSVSFKVEEASFVVILGPSGCGKSTILRMIAGLETPSAGQVRIGGRDVTRVDPAKRGLAMVFQSYALFPHLSVAENIIFGLKVRRTPAKERLQRLHKTAELVGLEHVLERKPSQLSGGQRQRVALARAIIAEHPVCLMDEPLSNLDAKLRNEMRIELRELQQRLRMSVIYVTHDQTEAMSMADNVLLMNNGRIEQQGAPDDIYARPASVFTARFIGAPPMNLLPVTESLGAALPPELLSGCSAADQLGVRPENLRLLEAQPGLPVAVTSKDYHGADTMVSVRLEGGDELMVRVAGRAHVTPGEKRFLAWDPDTLHIFGENGKRQGP